MEGEGRAIQKGAISHAEVLASVGPIRSNEPDAWEYPSMTFTPF